MKKRTITEIIDAMLAALRSTPDAAKALERMRNV